MNFYNFFDLFLNSYNFFINFLVETILDLNILIFVFFTIATIFLMRGPKIETIKNVAIILSGFGTAAIAGGAGGPRRNSEEEEARKAEAEARKAEADARKVEAEQAKTNYEASLKRINDLEAENAALKAAKK
jgi:hypothetical protein